MGSFDVRTRLDVLEADIKGRVAERSEHYPLLAGEVPRPPVLVPKRVLDLTSTSRQLNASLSPTSPLG